MRPLAGNLSSVYSLYNLEAQTGENGSGDELITRDLANPKYTNYCVDFKGTLDHILYNKSKLEVIEFLEMPDESLITQEGALPSTLFPSDHLRIEAKFFIK